jgi:transcriptional regulator with XRE-family HTH domain
MSYPELPWPSVIRYLRLRNGLSQGHVKIRLGKTQAHWSYVESGRRGMMLDEFIELCRMHGESVVVAGYDISKRQASSSPTPTNVNL